MLVAPMQSDVDEALRLVRESKASLSDHGPPQPSIDPVTAVYSKIREYYKRTKEKQIRFAKIEELCSSFSPSVGAVGVGFCLSASSLAMNKDAFIARLLPCL